MASKNNQADRGSPILPAWLFPGLFGAFLGLALLKFGNPPIMAKFVERPTDLTEWIIIAWPLDVGYGLLGVIVVVGLFEARVSASQKWLLVLPLAWLGWQFISATHTVDAELTKQTLKHFVACAACFYLGLFCLGRERGAPAFWIPILCALGVIIAVGIDQHFGGLEQTRKYFYAYVYSNLPNVPPEYLKKISSNRIFSTLFYPNALAGVILLLLPVSLGLIWRLGGRLTPASRCLLIGLFAAGALACLYWSGSKGGWLLALLLALVALLHLRLANRIKAMTVAVVFVCGVTGFFVKYASFFEKGATSVIARFDYWRAAFQTSAANPVFGTGPGTFGVAYLAIKNPESEMSRLTHNDYLQQASDSGFPGCASYLALTLWVLLRGYAKPKDPASALQFLAWLGFLGWALQGTMEFGLYIPALAWPAFGLAGWLLAIQRGPAPPRKSPGA
jgi:O-antigen ligase